MLKQKLQQHFVFIIFSASLLSPLVVHAQTTMEEQEKFLRARVMEREQKMDHSAHVAPIDKSLDFHGVFYGYLPCGDCDGIKATLSLKQHNNYLLVTQPAKDSAREYYEKGKYSWDENQHRVVLTPRDEKSTQRQYRIESEGTLIQINNDGMPMAKDSDRFTLRRSDTVKARQVHIH